MDCPLIVKRTGRAMGGVAGAARAAVGLWMIVVAAGVPEARGQVRFAPLPRVDSNQVSSPDVFLPTDRALTRAMTRARERLAEREYHQALTFLHQVLSREEDSFLDESPDAKGRWGLKTTARRLIGELPPEGRDAYELLYGAIARRQLDAAAAAGDRLGVAQVVRQFYHTAAGYEAALVLARMESDSGHYLAATQLYQELLDAPRAVVLLDPQLTVLAALNHVAAGQPEPAAALLRSLVERDASAMVELGGRASPLPGSRSDLLAWLTERAGEPRRTVRMERDWATLHGNAARNARHGGGGPHLRARWQARVINDPKVEEFLTNRERQFVESDVVVIPAARPIAVGDVVLMRTPSKVVAVDWRTGKRIWETREEDGLDLEQMLPTLTSGGDAQQLSTPAGVLEQRLWDDALSMALSSDGERAYVIRGATIRPELAALAWQLPIMGGMPGATFPATNQLAAYDLATEGKLVWEIDGDRGSGELAGAFFLGAPLAVDNTLFVLAEIRSAVFLLALDPQSGQLQWQQQLVGLEQGVALDPRRRLAGSSPSYSGGMLVCPTAAGAVVAIDVVRRELAWVYQYARDALSPAELRIFLQQQAQNQLARANDHWLDSSAIIDDGRVFLSPPESQELHCVDLRSGAVLWKRRQGDAQFVGCVDGEHVLLVGSESVQALRVADGSPAWKQPTLALAALPAGQGYLSAGRYYLPLVNGDVVAIDVTDGTLVGTMSHKTGPPLGNLICCRGSVLSQSSLVLDKFEQFEALQQRVQAALDLDADDAVAIRELAELKLQAGELTAAIELLKRAHTLASDDPLVREMLVECLLDALAEDYRGQRDDVPLLRSLIASELQELELLRLEAAGLDELGQRLAAWDVYLRIAELTGERPTRLQIAPDYTVQSDRWLAGRLAALWENCTSDERATITSRMDAIRAAWGPNPSLGELRRFLAHFGLLPTADSARLQLARRLIDRRQYATAELELLQLGTASVRKSHAAATVLMTKALVDSGKLDDAVACAAPLAGEWSDVVALDDLTGAQWIQRFADESPEFGRRTARRWPLGRIEIETNAVAAPRDRRGGRVRQGQPSGHQRLRIEQDFWPAVETMQWFIATDGSQLVGRGAAGTDSIRIPLERNSPVPQVRAVESAHAARVGHLLFVSLGGQVMAIDSRQTAATGEDDVLWRVYPRSKSTPASTRGALGPATPLGVVFFEQDELKCVDPLTGEAFWTREDVPSSCELFGDHEFVFAVDARQRVTYVINIVDGRLVERSAKGGMPDVPWMLTTGRNVAHQGRRTVDGKSSEFLRVIDALSNETLFDQNYQDRSRMTVVEPNLVIVYERTGKLQVVDVQRGKLLVDQPLEAVPNPQNIHALRSGDELFVAISGVVRQDRHQFIGVDYPLVNGLVYGFSLASGQPLWPTAAVVRDRGFALAMPQDVPLLVFVDHETQRDANGGRPQLRLLCLDKRTGQSVFRNDELPRTGVGVFRVRVERSRPLVAIEMSEREVRLTVTDRPRPPEPPAHDELTAGREFSETGLRAVVRRLSDAFRAPQEENPAQDNRRGRASNRRGGG